MDTVRMVFAVFLIASGIGHFLAPRYFELLVPDWLGPPARIVFASGLADVVVGILLLTSSTITVGAWLTATLLSIYMISHLDAFRRTNEAASALDRPPMVQLRIASNLMYIVIAILIAI